MARKAVETNEFGQRFREARKALGLRQDDFASDDVGRERISKIESGGNKATGADVRRVLARGFGVDADTFTAFYRNEITVEEFVGRASPARMRVELPAEPATDGEARWVALLELLRDRFSPAAAVKALVELPRLPTRQWGDYYAAAKRVLAPELGLDFAVEPGGPSPDAVRRRFLKK